MTSNNIKIYLDIDGVLLTTKQVKPAEHAVDFLNFVINNFDCYWLSTHCKGNKQIAINYLSRFFDSTVIQQIEIIKPTNWETLKTEAIDFTSSFFWIDDYPFNSEINILKKHDFIDRLIIVDLKQNDELIRIINLLKNRIN